MKTAACYIRVSTDMQTEFSPDSQLKLITEYAEKNNIILLEDHIYMEDGGKSGKSMAKRDKFLEMIAVAKKKPKPFDTILVWKFSRFARNQEEAIVLKSMLKRNEIDVVSISEPLPEGAFGDLVERIIEWTDSYYLVNLSQEVKRGMQERASRGLPVSPAPVGYDTKEGKYIPNADKTLIQGIYEDFLNGIGLRALAVKYGDMGLRTKRGNPPDNRCIEYILRNPVYAGKIRWSIDGRAASTRHYDNPNIMVVDGHHEPIVSQELFDKVQDKLDEQKRMYGKYQRREQPIEYMLKGLVRCSACNSTLVLVNTKSPSFQCHSYGRGVCKTSHSITIEKANQAIIEYLENVVITGQVLLSEDSTLAIASDTYKTYKKLIDNEKSKLARIKLAYQNGIDTLEEYSYNKAKIMKTISELEAAQKKSKPKPNQEEYRERIIKVLKTVRDPKQPENAKNSALRSIIQKIVFHKPDNSFEVYFY